MSETREWCSLPISNKERRKKFLILVPLAIVVFFVAGGIFWGIFSTIVILLSLLPFYTKTCYKLENGKIVVKKALYTFEKNLANFKKVYNDRYGIFLSPFKGRSILESFRGLFIQVDDESLKEELFNLLKKEIEGGS